MSADTVVPGTAVPEKRYVRFSFSRVMALATNTVTQLVRMRVIWFLAVFVVIVVATSFVFSSLKEEQQLKQLKDWSFGALQFFSVVTAIAGTALLLPKDLEDRTLYTILSKPVPRHEYLIGKLLGVVLLLGGGLLLMDVILSGVIWLKQSLLISANIAALESAKSATPENINAVTNFIKSQGLTWSLQQGVWCVFLKVSVMAAFTLMLSCVASSTLFTIIVSFLFAIAGQGEWLLRDFFFKSAAVLWKKAVSIALAVFIPDLGMFDLLSTVTAGDAIPLDVLGRVTLFAAGYIILYGAVAHLVFSEKEL